MSTSLLNTILGKKSYFLACPGDRATKIMDEHKRCSAMMHSRQMYVLFHNQCNLLFITLFQKPNNYKNIFYVLELVIVC